MDLVIKASRDIGWSLAWVLLYSDHFSFFLLSFFFVKISTEINNGQTVPLMCYLLSYFLEY